MGQVFLRRGKSGSRDLYMSKHCVKTGVGYPNEGNIRVLRWVKPCPLSKLRSSVSRGRRHWFLRYKQLSAWFFVKPVCSSFISVVPPENHRGTERISLAYNSKLLSIILGKSQVGTQTATNISTTVISKERIHTPWIVFASSYTPSRSVPSLGNGVTHSSLNLLTSKKSRWPPQTCP